MRTIKPLKLRNTDPKRSREIAIDVFVTGFKGVFIGVANIIPGISGGTVAFVTGVYHRLTEAIGFFFIRRHNMREYTLFLLNIGVGALIGILSFAKLVSILLANPQSYTYVPTFALFLGLIIGSLPSLIAVQKDTKFTALRFFLLVIGAIALISASIFASPSGITPEQNDLIHDFGIFKIVTVPATRGIWLFLIGIIAGFTMIIPGASGSAILVALGEYQHIMGYISDRSVTHIALVCLGAVVGVYVSTLAMAKLLEKRPGGTFYFVLGLVFASCLQLIIQMIASGAGIAPWLIGVATFLIGICLAFFPARYYHISKLKNNADISDNTPPPAKRALKAPIKNTIIKNPDHQ